MAPRTYQHPFKRLELTLPVRKELPAALPYVVLTCLAAYLDGLGKMLFTDFCNRHFETSTLQSLDSRAHNECYGDRVRSASIKPEDLYELPDNGVEPPFGNPTPSGVYA